MMRVLAFAALVGAVKAGLTSDGLACDADAGTRVVSPLCGYAAVKETVASETEFAACTSSATDCPCWSCLNYDVAPFEAMTADNDATEIAGAAALTVMTAATADACGLACGLGASNGPVVITTVDFELPSDDTVLGASGNWCGEWKARELAATCKTSIFDAKGLLFLIIIGGALSIIFFQCSIMAIIATVNGGKKDDDAKP